jgi:hypothetical protein
MMRRTMIVLFSAASLCGCAAQQGRVTIPASPPLSEPASFVGATAVALRTALGSPAFMRRDGHIEMWRYAGAGCQAFFFLYPDHGTLKVQHVETLPRPKASATDPNCLRSLNSAMPPVS